MDIQAAPARQAEPPEPVEVEDAEAALIEHYPRLVRIAYLTLPAEYGLHRRVLLAHRLVQRALPRIRRAPGEEAVGAADPAYALVRLETLRGALAYGRQPAGRRRWLRDALVAAPLPPQVVGLRLFPRAGGSDELALDRALARLDAPARAACALRGVEGLKDDEAAVLLAAAGVKQARRAVRAAAAVWTDRHERLLSGGEFDPCTVQARPTDLMRRRQHVRAGAAAAAAIALSLALLGVPGSDGDDYGVPPGAQRAALGRALDPQALVRAKADAWQRTGRLDFAAWPTRGNRTGDRALLGRALAAWADPGRSVQVSATPGTAQTVPSAAPHLLYAGQVDGAGVVLLYDGLRLVRYAEPADGSGGRALDFARADGARGTSAAAVLLTRSPSGARYLTAPWITGVQLRNLLRPEDRPQQVQRSADGVTSLVAVPRSTPDGGCAGPSPAAWPGMVLTADQRVADPRSVLLTDLGDLTPVRLAYAGGDGPKAGDATGRAALGAWSRIVCQLVGGRGQGVRSVGTWEFADQQLPEGEGTAGWLCTRADTWVGTDRVLVQFLPPARSATVVSQADDTAACGPYDPRVLSAALWRSRAGHWYLLAAGSAGVTSITAGGGVRQTQQGHTFAAPAQQTSQARLSARLGDGSTLLPLT